MVSIDCVQVRENLFWTTFQFCFHSWIHISWVVNSPTAVIQYFVDSIIIYLNLCLYVLCCCGKITLSLLTDVVFFDKLIQVNLDTG